MIQEAYCSFKVSKLLKEKGFDVPCQSYWLQEEDGEVKPQAFLEDFIHNWNSSRIHMSRPTHQMVLAWLREVHKIHIQAWCPVIDMEAEILGVKYNVVISNLNNKCIAFNTEIDDAEYDSYEEAIEVAIKYTLENLI